MKVGDLVRVDNKAQTIGVVMCVDSASEHRPRIQVLSAEGEMCWWWEHHATIISEVISEGR
ncbi:MAG: hypothetical protein VW270_23505 [Candidatus Poseidoniales archaeon]